MLTLSLFAQAEKKVAEQEINAERRQSLEVDKQNKILQVRIKELEELIGKCPLNSDPFTCFSAYLLLIATVPLLVS